ncbi:SnoaL-like domain-containing protein [Dyadobacter soli]|uniref:SnoaL-like domain-containing protein n=1 Tax=Dyadobacter soli TaxID=659014 RepID=A0A1G7VL08_9BACT|nr:nuclear transport factor 2 family protein [Dyadobacter soli]SDG60261.1 SnoaL-like domain-containing protein [Dyadobacter soli]
MNKQEIIRQIERLFSGTDARDWRVVEATFSEKVLLDYSSMTGLPAAVLTREEIIRQWSAFLPGFDSTKHQLGGFQMEFGENSAIVHLDGKADHYLNDRIWSVEGTYDVKVEFMNGDWLICEFKFNFLNQSGDTDLPSQAIKRLEDKLV